MEYSPNSEIYIYIVSARTRITPIQMKYALKLPTNW